MIGRKSNGPSIKAKEPKVFTIQVTFTKYQILMGHIKNIFWNLTDVGKDFLYVDITF